MINNRQNGRRRGRGGGNNGGGNNQRQGGGGSQGRGDSANRIDSRARGNANQLYEKYKNLARDAQMSGDRVNIEYYLQFADHYFRVLADTRSRTEDANQPRRQQPFDLDGFDDEENEGDPIRAGEQNGDDQDARQNGNQQDRQQNDRQYGDRQQNYRRERGDNDQRGDQRGDQRNARGGNDAGERDGRGQRPRRDREEIGGQHRADTIGADESLEERAEQVMEADAPAPRRRGRPRREDAAPVATEDAAIGADRLPPSLGIAAANDSDEDEPKPRRRVRRPAAEAPAAE